MKLVVDFRIRIMFAVLALASLAQVGCQPASDNTLEMLDTKLTSLKIDDLARTMDFVFSDKRFDQDEFVRIVTAGMNRWTRSEVELFQNDGWEVDPLLKPVLEQYGSMTLVRDVPEMNFVNTDAYYFQQSAWLSKIASRITEDKNLAPFELFRLAADYRQSDETEDPLAEVMRGLHDGLSAEASVELSNGLRAFDWIIRNIYLEATPEKPDDELAPGPGYRRFPWQNLIYARGDYVERGKVFILLAEQLGLESVMLSVGEGDNASYWCPALLVDGKAYLFDTKLGLPIPGEKKGTIATLAEVRKNPELLSRLDLSVEESLADETTYWVKGQDLDSLEALIYSSPELCSRRMYHLEKNLSDNYKLKLSSSASKIAEAANGIDVPCRVWEIGFETHEFRRRIREAIKLSADNDVVREKIRWHFVDESYVDGFPVYRTGRARYFNGRFTTEGRRRTAIESFYALMYSDKQIADLATDSILQRQLGFSRKGQDAASFMRRIKGVQGQMKLVRRDAGYYLAQCHFDKGNIGTAANWLKRLLDKGNERWEEGIQYLLGRALEARGEYDEALDIYAKAESSSQHHGNLIRKRMLKELVGEL